MIRSRTVESARMPTRFAWIAALAFAALVGRDAQAGPTLESIRARGHLSCGVSADAPGLSRLAATGRYDGFEADLCRAVAAAIFGDAETARFRPLATKRQFLADPEIDLVFRGLTWTFARETDGSGVRFGPVVLYDGQAFLVGKRLGVAHLDQLRGRRVCVEGGNHFQARLQRTDRERGLALVAVPFDSLAAAEAAFFTGACDALTADATELAAALIARPASADAYVILPERISKEPLAPLMRRGDEEFFDIVRWTTFALIEAEELGITSANAARASDSDDRRIRAFVTAESKRLGLRPGWTKAVIRSVGNYGEVYDRALGGRGPARLARGLNALWTRGGLLYAPPFR
jgi:general L-amino acid transport system substrate-binding protein